MKMLNFNIVRINELDNANCPVQAAFTPSSLLHVHLSPDETI